MFNVMWAADGDLTPALRLLNDLDDSALLATAITADPRILDFVDFVRGPETNTRKER